MQGEPRPIRGVIVGVLLFVAVARVVYYDAVRDRVDETVLLLLGLAAAMYVVPWERISGFKAAGVELTVELPQVAAAVDALGLDRIQNQRLRERIRSLGPVLPQVRGARVLWIDDKPHDVISERRLLRALGIDITTAVSSRDAADLLTKDNDFDLLISDVQRVGDSHLQTGGIEIHEGVNFVVALRSSDNPVIRSLPVVFYAAYDWPRLVRFTRPARETFPEPRISNAVDQLVPRVLEQLAESRRHPIAVPAKKVATDFA